MPTHTTKPIAVEAFQMTFELRNKRDAWPEWLRQTWDANVVGYYPGGRMLRGMETFYWGDWIVQGDGGTLHPCTPRRFAASHVPAIQEGTD